MYDHLEEIEKYSPFGGELILEEVKGSNNTFVTAENSVYAKKGLDRDMYSYVPKSGCPDAKQCQVLIVLRNENTKESAEKIMHDLELDKLAEERHFVLLFPNPLDTGWNYQNKEEYDDDMEFFIRCFAALPKSKGGVAGFNGMIFYIATTPESSALLSEMSIHHPLDSSCIMLGKFPDDYTIKEKGQFQNAWIYDNNTTFEKYLEDVNAPIDSSCKDHHNTKNPNIKYFVSELALSKEEVYTAWEELFSISRRWRNDTYGCYQERTNFEEKGFIPHVKDSSLGVNDGYAHTWYEYIPEKIRNTSEKVPLVFYFHGGNCIPLYGAEQSDWHRIAEKENFIVIYPRASKNKTWNVWDDDTGPSDFAFVLALIEHIKTVHPIDETRIYASGFSMGSMMTNAVCCVYPEIFAAGAAFHAQHFGYLKNRSQSFNKLGKGVEVVDDSLSKTHVIADEKKVKYDYLVPMFQATGLLDGLAGDSWPISTIDNRWLETIDYWKAYDHIPVTPYVFTNTYETGIEADKTFYDGEDERFIHHMWYGEDKTYPMYHFFVAKRVPHAIDIRTPRIAWSYIKHFKREKDGKLTYVENL